MERATLPVIRTRCREIFDRRNELIGVVDLEAANTYRLGMNAIEKFVGNREGRDDVRRSARILECAVGAALGESPGPGRPGKISITIDISPDDRYLLRLIFQYRHVWEPILVERGLSRSQGLPILDDLGR